MLDLIPTIEYAMKASVVQLGSNERTLFCDPLTGLVSYPCFERLIIDTYPHLKRTGFAIAIGDVDGLKAYVQKVNLNDPHSFGHLAGNACMQIVGSLTRDWHDSWLSRDRISVCATFGGDEVIILAQSPHEFGFVSKVRELSLLIKEHSPRPCSFAVGSISSSFPIENSREGYREMVSTIDRALFRYKSLVSDISRSECARVLDLGNLHTSQKNVESVEVNQ